MEDALSSEPAAPGSRRNLYRASQPQPLILEGKQPGGQLTTTSEVENFPGFPEGIDGYDLMDQLAQTSGQVRRKGRECVCGQGRFQQPVKVLYAGDRKLEAKTVIIATGARPGF